MKKITAREFQKKFGSVNARMRPGETLEVTRRGKTAGQYIKGGYPPVKMPDFAKLARKQTITPAQGSKLIKEFFGE